MRRVRSRARSSLFVLAAPERLGARPDHAAARHPPRAAVHGRARSCRGPTSAASTSRCSTSSPTRTAPARGSSCACRDRRSTAPASPRASPARRSTAPTRNGEIGNAGAISATIGQYGEDVGLVTPIEQMLEPAACTPPSGVRRAPQLLRRRPPARLAARAVRPRRRRCGTLLEHVARSTATRSSPRPPARSATFAPQPLVPGASSPSALSSGAVAAGAIGTVTYRDGNDVYALRPSVRGRRPPRAAAAGRLRLHGHRQPARHAGCHLLQARRPGPRARHAHERRADRRRRHGRRGADERCR